MERLTKRNEYGVYYPYCDSAKGCGGHCASCEFERKITKKLEDYEDAEEQGLLKILPVAIGSDVYFIPSKVNYELNVLNSHEENNRVYHQKVANIVFNERGWYLKCNLDLEYGVYHILVDKLHKETWFTSKEEAEQALKRMESE